MVIKLLVLLNKAVRDNVINLNLVLASTLNVIIAKITIVNAIKINDI